MWAFFRNLPHVNGKTDRRPREILIGIYLRTRNSPLNFASHRDLDSSTGYASAGGLHLELLLSVSLCPVAAWHAVIFSRVMVVIKDAPTIGGESATADY